MMMSHQSRRMLPPGNTKKCKHAEADKPATPEAAKLIPSNRLLAGYLAHEFLTKGTLFGQKFEPDATGDEILTCSAKPMKSQSNLQAQALAAEPTRCGGRKEHESYGEVASIMKTNGTHIKGIVNPTQLDRWIHDT